MKRFLAFLYGIVCYLLFFGTFLWMIFFVGDFRSLVPTTINSGVAASWPQALFINIGLIILFGLQHTLMARKSFKEWWTNFIPKSIERSTYVLFSSVAILLLLWFWQPLNATIWAVEVTWAALILEWVFWLGWLIVFLSTWMIDHFNLFGIKQVYLHLKNKEQDPPELLEPGFYKFVRHPLMLGFLIAFWSTPLMTAGHLLFSAGMTIYILIGVYFEEKALIHRFGDDYKEYREKVPQFFPGLK